MTINFIIKKEEHATRSIRVAIGPHRRLDEYISAVIETEDVVLHEKASLNRRNQVKHLHHIKKFLMSFYNMGAPELHGLNHKCKTETTMQKLDGHAELNVRVIGRI